MFLDALLPIRITSLTHNKAENPKQHDAWGPDSANAPWSAITCCTYQDWQSSSFFVFLDTILLSTIQFIVNLLRNTCHQMLQLMRPWSSSEEKNRLHTSVDRSWTSVWAQRCRASLAALSVSTALPSPSLTRPAKLLKSASACLPSTYAASDCAYTWFDVYV